MSNVQWETTIKADATTEDTLEAIVGFINKYCTSPFVEDVVEVTKEQSGGINTGAFLETLFAWACDNIDYKLDSTGTEELHTPELSWKNGLADCKKYSILLGSVCEAAGLNPICKWVEYSDNTAWTHIFIIIPLAGFDPAQRSTYIVLDPTNDCQYNTEVSYKKAVLYYLNGDTMELKGMGAKPKPNYGHFNFVQPHEIGWAGTSVLSKMRGPSGAGSVSTGQAWVAFLTMVHQNVNGMATKLVTMLAQYPDILNNAAASLGQNIDELKEAAIEGANVPAISSDSIVTHEQIKTKIATSAKATAGSLNTRWSTVAGQIGVVSANPTVNVIPSHYVGTAPQAWYTYKGIPLQANPPINLTTSTQQLQDTIDWYVACVNNGQDYNGYYGSFNLMPDGSHKYGTNASNDAEMRGWYNSLLTTGSTENFAGCAPNTGTFPVPLAKGAAKTGSVNVTTPVGLGQIITMAAPVAAIVADALAPGSGAIVGASVADAGNAITQANNAANGGSLPSGGSGYVPSSTNPPKPGSVAGSIGGFFFKAMLVSCLYNGNAISCIIATGAICITVGLLIKKYKTQWKKQLAH